MGRNKRYVKLIEEAEAITLKEGLLHHPKAEFRQRANALLMSQQGLDIAFIAKFCDVNLNTVGRWFTSWEKEGICGLMRQSGQGRKPILKVSNQDHIEALDKALEKHYQDVGRIKMELESQLQSPMSTDTVKRFLKKIITHGVEYGVVRTKDKTK
jgi:transposase